MPEFDLDSFKKTWQEQPVQEKYDNSEILQMLNRKSRNYVKYIFWISIFEFLFLSILGSFYILQNNNANSFLQILAKFGVKISPELDHNFNTIYLILKFLSISITAYFVYQFYKNYHLIKIEENLKNYIKNIIQFKKTVNAFILTNILIVTFFTSALTIFGIYAIQNQNTSLASPSILAFIVSFIISIVFCIALIWLYYRLVYGLLIKRLDKNLTQLKKIDSQEN